MREIYYNCYFTLCELKIYFHERNNDVTDLTIYIA